jgi:formylglycine-generating enzyme required for sulfatase activity
MVLIPAGEYTIGSPEKKDADGKIPDAYPEHKVKLNAFWIDKYEVTNREYLDFSVNTSYAAEGEAEGKTWRTFFSPEKANVPVVYLTWKDAEAYCKAGGMRLPTEEEWEAAARGPEGLRYPWGNEWDATRANTADAGTRLPVDVGTYNDVSPFGVHDMFGNVQEWTASWFTAYPGNNNKNPNYGERFRVVRGFSFHWLGGKALALWARSAYLPNYLGDFGFRCAKDATPQEAAKGAPAK